MKKSLVLLITFLLSGLILFLVAKLYSNQRDFDDRELEFIKTIQWKNRVINLSFYSLVKYDGADNSNQYTIKAILSPENLTSDDTYIYLGCIVANLKNEMKLQVSADSSQGNGKFYNHQSGISLQEHAENPLKVNWNFTTSKGKTFDDISESVANITLNVTNNCPLLHNNEGIKYWESE